MHLASLNLSCVPEQSIGHELMSTLSLNPVNITMKEYTHELSSFPFYLELQYWPCEKAFVHSPKHFWFWHMLITLWISNMWFYFQSPFEWGLLTRVLQKRGEICCGTDWIFNEIYSVGYIPLIPEKWRLRSSTIPRQYNYSNSIFQYSIQ